MVDGGDHQLDRHALDTLVRRRGYDEKILAVLFRARERLLLAVGLATAKLREAGDPLLTLEARIQELLARVAMLEQENGHLRSRLERIDARRRSYYTPSERFQILVFMKTWLLSIEETAQRFLVSPRTIARWLKEATREPAQRTVGCLVRAIPPLRAYSHVVRDLACTMESLGFGGSKRISQTSPVARSRSAPRPSAAGVSAAPATADVGCGRPHCRGALPQPRVDGRPHPDPRLPEDLLLRPQRDTRRPLPNAARGAAVRESAEQRGPRGSAGLRYHTARHTEALRFGPRVAVHGEAFRTRLSSLGIRQRFGAIGQYGSIAIVERLWRTAKQLLSVRRWSLVHPSDMRERLEATLAYYAYLKPHQGLGGAVQPRSTSASAPPISTPAGRPASRRSKPQTKPSRSRSSILEGRLPLLVPKVA
jgi:hypothetical protein